MRIPLQQLDHRSSSYERPNQDWVCGWARDGHACKLGPDGKGRCTAQAQAHCAPVREGDRWVCTRADVFGGTCEQGPLPDGRCCNPKPEQEVCQPVRSMRAKRALVVRLAAMLALGILVIGLAGPWRLHFTSPGELSASHMAIQGPPGSQNCGVCHVSGDTTFGGWVKAALMSGDYESNTAHQSSQCLACHFSTSTRDQAAALRVHSRSEEAMARMAEKSNARADSNAAGQPGSGDQGTASPGRSPMALAGLTTASLDLAELIHGKPQFDDDVIPCATCHREHLGPDHNMKAMSDAKCQVCHETRFESFNKGHPEFTALDHTNRGIIFDHSEHATRFEGGKLKCAQCHEADPLGRTMLVRPFETACEGCHAQGSEDHHGDAIKKNALLVLQLPSMEFDEKMYWPMDYAYAERLTPMMTMLLAGDDAAVPMLKSITYDSYGDLYEWQLTLEDNDETEKKAELAQAIKHLVKDLAEYSDEGAEARSQRIAAAFDTTTDDPAVRNLAAELASASFVMQMFKQRYMPQLDQDMKGEDVSSDDDESDQAQWMTSKNMSGWRVDSDEGTISYRPVVHADGLLKHWIEAVVKFSHRPLAADADALAKDRHELLTRIAENLENDFRACTECHSEQGEHINWTAAGRQYAASGYVKFNHRPHMAMLHDPDNCTTCHVLKTGSGENMVHGFEPHRKAVCENCHAPGNANNTCLNCHQYHETRPNASIVTASVGQK
ncbi:MAG: hypothetical protein KDI19_09945 [Pseudomonadales bacterium]|nr:hypothetical protein [Pseudomonadales bacterium]